MGIVAIQGWRRCPCTEERMGWLPEYRARNWLCPVGCTVSSLILFESGYQSDEGEIGGLRRREVRKVSPSDREGDSALDDDVRLHWPRRSRPATKGTVGAEFFLFGCEACSEWGRPSRHHCHPNGDELLFILEGEGAALEARPSGSALRGRDRYIPANELHGFKNSEAGPERPCRAIRAGYARGSGRRGPDGRIAIEPDRIRHRREFGHWLGYCASAGGRRLRCRLH